MERYFTLLLFAVPLGILGLLLGLHIKARKMVKDWASRNNYEIIKLRYRYFWKGPFEFNYSPKRQKIFYVSVIDERGEIQNAFAKVGDFWKGLIKDAVEIKWEKDKNKKLPG